MYLTRFRIHSIPRTPREIFATVHVSRLPPRLWYRLVTLRGHVTNASFKQWVGILLMPKIDIARKNYLKPKIWGEAHLREIFYGTLIFQQSSMICMPSNMAARSTFCLYLVKRLIVTLRCAVNITTTSFLHFPWSLSAKFVFSNKNHILVTWPSTNLLFLRKWCGFEKPNHYYFV